MYVAETVVTKSIKRVRFSDEVQSVFEFDVYEEGEEAFPMENENDEISENNSQKLQQSFSEDLMKDDKTNYENIPDEISCVLHCRENIDNEFSTAVSNKKGDDLNNLVDTAKNESSLANISVSSHLDDITINTNLIKVYDQSEDNNVDTRSESIVNAHSHGLKEIIDTEVMSVTTTEAPQSESIPSLAEASMCSSLTENVEKDEDVSLDALESNLECVLGSHKRCLEESQMEEKQSTKITNYLKKHCPDLKSAVDIKNAVFAAWKEVKNKERRDKCAAYVSGTKTALSVSAQTLSSSKKSLNVRGRPKEVPKKMSVPSSKLEIKPSAPQKTKEDLEANKMAFQAWKEKKDSTLSFEALHKSVNKQREELESFYKEEKRKKAAEAAYSEWKSHKQNSINLEKKKAQWLENEKIKGQVKRDDEALKAYEEWLKNKVYEKKTKSVIEERPPWYPPGI